MIKKINSLQNPVVKRLEQLIDKSRERRKSGLFVVEGKREIEWALTGGYRLKQLFFCPAIFPEEEFIKYFSEVPEAIEISLPVYQKLAYRKTTEGVLALLFAKEHGLDSLDFNSKNPLILVAEAPEKPGNIGALLRTADAARLDAVIIANPKTDLYNPNIIRSSVGGVFTNRIAMGSTSEIISFLKNKNIAIYGAALQASQIYTQVDFTGPSALVVGTEDTGLTVEWLQYTTQNIRIPMEGVIDSMNVSVAAGILIFEAKRQRNG